MNRLSHPYARSIPAAGIILLALGVMVLSAASRIDPRDFVLEDNCRFLSRDGAVLRFIPDHKGERHVWLPLEEIPEVVRKAFVAAEDERFYSHPGFDAAAIVRAAVTNIRCGRIVSGASTITQQLARLVYPRRRTYPDKLVEIVRSVRIELAFSKDRILEYYLNRIPMGHNIVGVGLAALIYFGKPCSQLTATEAAMLAALPKAPGRLSPYGKDRARLLARKDWVLNRMTRLGFLSPSQIKRAATGQVTVESYGFPNEAPHLVNLLLDRMPAKAQTGDQVTTIDLVLQKALEGILHSHQSRLAYQGAFQGETLVLHNPTMEVLASVGSLSYSGRNQGYNNGTTALRSAGSTLKPFIYAQALESGHTVACLLEDTLQKYRTPEGDYAPDNFDRREYGPVTMRSALGNSLNISAVKLLNRLGLEPFYGLLQRLCLINYPENDAAHYGLGLVLGNPEVSLEQLVTAYAAFANRGVFRPIRYLRDSKHHGTGKQLFSEATAHIISDMLSDPSARTLTFGNSHGMRFPFPVALKTGTSTGYRDCWIIGYTPEYTVGVWAGNFEGTPTWGLSGASGAAPILKDIFSLLYAKKSGTPFQRPETVIEVSVCGISGMKPTDNCRYVTRELFIRGTEPGRCCTFHDQHRFFHELPASFASWLYHRNRTESAGSYRLKGFPSDLAQVFSEISSENMESGRPASVLIRGAEAMPEDSAASKGPVSPASAQPRHGHLSVGAGKETGPAVAQNRGGIRIVYPLPSDKFIMENRYRLPYMQTIALQALSGAPIAYVDWFVDGVHHARAGPPYHTLWNLHKGKHMILAVAPDQQGDAVEIFVE